MKEEGAGEGGRGVLQDRATIPIPLAYKRLQAQFQRNLSVGRGQTDFPTMCNFVCF